jgi:hypothetical protein
MPPTPYLLIQFISFCSLLSHLSAGIHYCFISSRLLKVPFYILNLNGKSQLYKNLNQIWYTRLVRRVVSVSVRSPLRLITLRLVNLNITIPPDSGCVIAICHTPWKRLLVQWCLENNFSLIIAGGRWTKQRGTIQRQALGITDLRCIVNYLKQNGRIVIACDIFNDLSNCPVSFLGKHHNVSLLPARLARIAGVPLITAIPVLRKGKIHFDGGPQFDLNNPNADSRDVMQQIVLFLETEIKNDPSIWLTTYHQNFV